MNSVKSWLFAESALAITFVASESFQRFVDDTKVYGCKWQCLLYSLIPEVMFIYMSNIFVYLCALHSGAFHRHVVIAPTTDVARLAPTPDAVPLCNG